MDNILVYCELDGARVASVSLELLCEGRRLADRLGVALEAVALGHGLDSVPQQVFKYGADRLHLFDDRRLEMYTAMPQTSAIVSLVKENGYQIFLLGSTAVGRDLAPRIAAALGCGLTADNTSLGIGSYEDKERGCVVEELLYQSRPAFAGNLVATIVTPYSRPQMATVREGVIPLMEMRHDGYVGEVVRYDVSEYVCDADFVVEVLERHVGPAANNLKDAQVVVAGGYGVGSKETFDGLFELARLLHGEVGATRAAIDAGYTTHDRMIGSTGLTVRPKLYFAFGISGQAQHLTGMRDSDIIVSVNSDYDAPINAIADYVITGKVEEVLPKLLTYYQQRQ